MLAGILVIAGAALAFVGGGASDEPAGPQAAGADMPDVTPFTISERSIAVLPFEDHSPNPDDAYLAGAVANEIAGALTKVPGLRVSLASSTARFDRNEMAAEDFASTRLGTAYVVDGSVQAHEKRIRVTVKLLDATSGELRWNERYDLPRDTVQDILDLQVDVAERVANELATTLTDQSVERMMSGWTDDPVAYDLYLQADSYEGRTLEDHRARIPLLEQAVARDSGFAMAYFMLGDAHYQVAARQPRPAGTEDSSGEAEGLPLLSRAIEIADDPVLRTNLRAFQLLIAGDSEEAIQLARSIVLEHPNDPMSLETLMAAYQSAGRVVDVAEVGSRLLALDPLSPERRYGAGRFTLGLGMDSVALTKFREAVELGDERGWEGLLDVHLFRGDTSAARELVDSARSTGIPSLDVLAFKERARAGDLEAARTILDRIDEQQLRDRVWKDAPLIADVYLLTGDSTRADVVLREAAAVVDLHWENRAWAPGIFAVRGDASGTADAMRAAVDMGMHQASWIEADPVYARVRGRPDFEEALGEVERLIDRQRREIERQIAEEE
jgi:TolB-like protein/tetratricopeptide (TPR) repeat protein